MHQFVKQFISIATALYPERKDTAQVQSEEMNVLILDGNPAFEDWGIYKVVATFCIRSYESQFDVRITPKPLANIAVREYLELALESEVPHQEIRERVEGILKGYGRNKC